MDPTVKTSGGAARSGPGCDSCKTGRHQAVPRGAPASPRTWAPRPRPPISPTDAPGQERRAEAAEPRRPGSNPHSRCAAARPTARSRRPPGETRGGRWGAWGDWGGKGQGSAEEGPFSGVRGDSRWRWGEVTVRGDRAWGRWAGSGGIHRGGAGDYEGVGPGARGGGATGQGPGDPQGRWG